jgi:predicted unusual protein kinase regulating ubiquinone biosynthesis (AarF/ABC1/UbiB family)
VLVWGFEKAFDLPMYWSVPFTIESLMKETDFVNEARNAERAYENLVDKKSIYVPKVKGKCDWVSVWDKGIYLQRNLTHTVQL